MTIAVDFDGVLTPNGHWPNTGEPNTKLIEWLIMFRGNGRESDSMDKQKRESPWKRRLNSVKVTAWNLTQSMKTFRKSWNNSERTAGK